MKSKQSQSRSEQLRGKRKSGSTAPAPKRRRKQSSTDRGHPPMMVRGSKPASAAKRPKKKGKRAKRRFDIALPTPGVEVRMPSIPSIRVDWRLLSLLLVFLFSAVLYYVFNSPTYRVHDVQIDGLARLSDDTISRSLLVYNKPIFMIEPEALEDQIIKTYPGVISTSVRVGFPARVEVLIEEREPLVAWEQDSDIQWVDAQGMAFPKHGEAENLVRVLASASPPAPFVLEDESPEAGEKSLKVFMSAKMVESIIALNGNAPVGVPIVFDDSHGFGWRDPSGWDVYFGSPTVDTDMLMKLSIYEAVVQRLKADGIQPAMISVEYLHAPYFRMEN